MPVKTAIADLRQMRIPAFGLAVRSEAALVAERIVHPDTNVPGQPSFDLEGVSSRIRAAYRQRRSPDRRDLGLAAWCLWDGAQPLANDGEVRRRFLADVERSGRRSLFRRLAAVFLIRFPKHHESIGDVADTLRRLAPRFQGPWAEAEAKLDLFRPDAGVRNLARTALERRTTVWRALREYGIGILPANAAFIEEAFLAGLAMIPGKAENDYGRLLELITDWGVEEGKIMFDQHRGAFVDALVLPHAEATLPRQWRDAYLGFLVSHFGDPRLRRGRWGPMPRAAKIVRGWLTDQTLKQFLDVLDDRALKHQWKYRRAFWEAVHRYQLVSEAWVIFDRTGAKGAEQLFEGEEPFARFQTGGSKPIQSGHACLLLRVGNGIVAEWSHTGKCYIWHDAKDDSAPTMFKKTYISDEVTFKSQRPGRVVITHSQPRYYNWQRQVADEIHRMTGLRVQERDFEVRR